MAERKGRILLGKLGEGRKEGMLNLARSLSEAGFEVVYTELGKAEAIVQSALQEFVDHIGITLLPDADLHELELLMSLLKSEHADHITVTAGGYLTEDQIPRIGNMGLMAFFPSGTPFAELVEWSRDNITIKNL
jgi:methylmalonyl-CoA mutase, C-terminal domain